MESNTMLHVLMLHLGQRKAALPVQEIRKNTFFKKKRVILEFWKLPFGSIRHIINLLKHI